MSKLKLVICASASFYPEVIEFSSNLKKLNIKVILPSSAVKMRDDKENNIEAILDWSKATNGRHRKSIIMREHMIEISKADALLVMNYEKHNKPNYIGPNVLMEMAVAFYLNVPIYVLYDQPNESPFIDEILGLKPTFLHGDISRIK